MSANDTELYTMWVEYQTQELLNVRPILERMGYSLDESQVHLGGERFLMTGFRDVGGGGKKLVLTGTRAPSGDRVIIKASSDRLGQEEILREREARERINHIEFAYHTFTIPKEYHFGTEGPHLIAITEYIGQDTPLLSRGVDEQFFLTLKALEAQEGVHATASIHSRVVNEMFGSVDADQYISEFRQFLKTILSLKSGDRVVSEILSRAEQFLATHRTTLERYGGFLTHADFVPNNFRVRGHELYLLDYASIHFGNKYESWARLLNFMVHHNPSLERTLSQYVRENRTDDEYLSLRLMRVFKLGFLLKYYAEAIPKTKGSIRELMQARFDFWTMVMECVLDDVPMPPEAIDAHIRRESMLRSEDERARQREMIGISW